MILKFRPKNPEFHRYRAEEITGPLPPVLYKIIDEPYASRLVMHGEIQCSTLNWFQHHEDPDRGDHLEGTRNYFPAEGLDLHRFERWDGTPDDTRFHLPSHGFQSRAARSHRIFIFSTTLDSDLTFGNTAREKRVEIYDPAQLAQRIRLGIARHHKALVDTFIHDEVTYWTPEMKPKEAWALPHRLTMLKHNDYRPQREYRFAYGTSPDVFDFENVELSIRMDDDRPRIAKPDPKANLMKLRLGSLQDCCRLP